MGLGWTCRSPLGWDTAQHNPQGPKQRLPSALLHQKLPLSHSAMAVESFTATAPFVQIGRFFLSAGESQAPLGEPASTRGPALSPGRLPGAGALALSPQMLKGVPCCPGHGVSRSFSSIVLWAEARGQVCPQEVGNHVEALLKPIPGSSC